MTFNLTNFLKILEQVGPFALAATGVPAPLIPVIVHGIGLAEQATADTPAPVTGAAKKAMVLDGVDTVTAGMAAAGIKMAPGYAAAVGHGIDTTVAVVNLISAQRALAARP